MKLETVKKYLHMDDDITEDDEILQGFMAEAQRRIEVLGKVYDDTDPIMRSYVMMFCKQSYEGRMDALMTAALQSKLDIIELSDSYEAVSS